MQSRIMKLQRDEDKVLKKIQNERSKAEELQRVRDEHNAQMAKLRYASMERDHKVIEYAEQIR